MGVKPQLVAVYQLQGKQWVRVSAISTYIRIQQTYGQFVRNSNNGGATLRIKRAKNEPLGSLN